MINVSQLPPRVLNALYGRGHDLTAIAQMSPSEVFREFCEWEGLINWAFTLENTLDAIRQAKVLIAPAAETGEKRFKVSIKLPDQETKGEQKVSQLLHHMSLLCEEANWTMRWEEEG